MKVQKVVETVNNRISYSDWGFCHVASGILLYLFAYRAEFVKNIDLVQFTLLCLAAKSSILGWGFFFYKCPTTDSQTIEEWIAHLGIKFSARAVLLLIVGLLTISLVPLDDWTWLKNVSLAIIATGIGVGFLSRFQSE